VSKPQRTVMQPKLGVSGSTGIDAAMLERGLGYLGITDSFRGKGEEEQMIIRKKLENVG
jgi:hypothetical protein